MPGLKAASLDGRKVKFRLVPWASSDHMEVFGSWPNIRELWRWFEQNGGDFLIGDDLNTVECADAETASLLYMSF